MRRLLSILFWSILSAAFIGPGTVTVASTAGHRFGLTLLWALTFSTIACIVLQEASARIAIGSGRDLGQALRFRFARSWARYLVLPLVVGAVVVGCAAYQAGNILGGVAGAQLEVEVDTWLVTLVMGLVAGVLLWFGSVRWVARILGCVVALMGAAFLCTAAALAPDAWQLLRGATLPQTPQGSGLLVLGLIGTTVVPYNLFLGSGIARGQSQSEVRFGLVIAIALGGLVSMGVVVVGSSVQGEFSFQQLSLAVTRQLGDWAGPLFALGLFAAGLSSAITAPLAAAITAQGLFADERREQPDPRSTSYRVIWILVLLTGVGFGLFGQKPIPIILLAQALNGVLLPFVAIFLLMLLNDRELVGPEGLNRPLANLLLGGVVAVTVLLGLTNLLKATCKVLEKPLPEQWKLLLIAIVLTGVLAVLVVPMLRRLRSGRFSKMG